MNDPSPDDPHPDGPRPHAPHVVSASFALNVAILAALIAGWIASGSQLLLAQAADSLTDLLAGAVLWTSAHLGTLPRDENHPFGHQRAEPIGALVIAVLTGVLAFEVARSATGALWRGAHPDLGLSVAAVLASKLAIKTGLLVWLTRLARRTPSAAIEATRIDTSNDVASSASSLLGWLLVQLGLSWADGALALPVALYVALNGFSLARTSIGQLMGEAPPKEVLDELLGLAQGVPGVLGVGRIRAQLLGPEILVQVEVVVDPGASATAGHDIGLDVQDALEAHPQVGEAFVHVDTPAGRDH